MKRARADRELYDCVKAAGYPVQARIMYVGVRMFGAEIWRRHRKLDEA